MNVAWFWMLAAMLTAYAALDGFDLGVGALHVCVARGDRERRIALNAIGPVWNGNEVWLLAAGGMMVVAFPKVYAAGFSGFYLALMLVLWLLILRGVSIEFRSQLDHPLWRTLWDGAFCFGSLLLALLLGVALGNVVRGLPIGPDGYFQGTFALLLNPYALLAGLLSLSLLAWHGANYLRVKTEDALLKKARRWSRALVGIVAALFVFLTVVTFWVRPDAAADFRLHPLTLIFPAISALGLAGGFFSWSDRRDRAAFRSSSLLIIGLMGSASATIFPSLLTSTVNPAYSLTIYNAASSPLALRASFIANLVGMLGVIVYTTYAHRTFRGKVRLGEHSY
jgi:cytochrome bd ubiquinol oxidase subunit II